MTVAPSDRELIDQLREQRGWDVIEVSRAPYRYATSAPLEEVRVRMRERSDIVLIFKDLSRERLLDDALATKPDWLYQPRREVETYRRILTPAGEGPRCVAAVADADPPRHWLLMEKVPGVELWQVGELSVWEEVASWLAGFHARFAGRLDEVQAANPYLLELSDSWFRSWGDNARVALDHSTDSRAPVLRNSLDRYGEVIASLVALPRTMVHGELYPSNVLVVRDESRLRVCPVDWEMAATGPGLVDLAALVGGWGAAERRRLVAAYVGGLTESGVALASSATVDADLARCRLHLALQWLGWSIGWRPPSEHAHDWIGEALILMEELGLA